MRTDFHPRWLCTGSAGGDSVGRTGCEDHTVADDADAEDVVVAVGCTHYHCNSSDDVDVLLCCTAADLEKEH